MAKPILYMGDTSLDSAASYLAGLMHSFGWEFDYLASDETPTDDSLADRRLFVFSDYPAGKISHDQQRAVVEQVRRGAGLLMIGGWESFQGLGGGWRGEPVGDALPVEIAAEDDRVNGDQTTLIRCLQSHSIVDGLPWTGRPPAIGGFNRLYAKSNTDVLLVADQYEVCWKDQQHQFTKDREDPLLVIGVLEQGRIAALATDAAPHWVGPFVDWGTKRIIAHAPQSELIEVGSLYAQFFRQLLAWGLRPES